MREPMPKTSLISRFFLAPKVSALRFLPMNDESAEFLHRWIMAIAWVASFGFLTCGIYRVVGVSEAKHLMVVAILELVIVAMIITMILQKREYVKQALGKNLAETGLRTLIVRIWHWLAISALILLWILSGFDLLLGGVRPGAPGIQTLLIIPLYFLLDWALREILRVVFGIAANPEDVRKALVYDASGHAKSQLIPAQSEDSNIPSLFLTLFKSFIHFPFYFQRTWPRVVESPCLMHRSGCQRPQNKIARSGAGILVTDGPFAQPAGAAYFSQHIFSGFHALSGGLFKIRQRFGKCFVILFSRL